MSSPSYSRHDGISPTVGPDRRHDEDDDDAWSGADTGDDDAPASRKRPRTARPMSVSCELCKQRKVKCDRGHPTCGWCQRNNQICEYKERKKPGLRAGYGRELEGRLDRLEGVISQQGQILQHLSAHLAGGQVTGTSTQSPDASQPNPGLYMQSSHPYPALDAVNNCQASLQASATATQQQQHQQQQSGFMQGGTQLQISTAPASGDHYNVTDPALESPSLNLPGHATFEGAIDAVAQDRDFPPYDLLYALTDQFFKHINTWCPILHRRTTLDSLFGPTTLEEADRILLHAIVATTLRFSTDSRLDAPSRERYHNVSKQKVLLYGLENSSVKALQALVILALDIMGTSNGPPGWNLLALITRSVVQLGLAVETTSASVAPLYPSIYTLRAMVLPEPKSFIEDESRRRLFWMVYLLDRYATVSTAFEFALDEKEIDRKLPCRDDLFSRNQPVETRWFPTNERTDYSTNRPENLGSFSYYIEIIGILSQIHRFLKKPVDISALADVEQWQQQYRDLDSKLTAWKLSLPSEYGNMSRLFNQQGSQQGKIVNCLWVMLHVTYHTSIVRLHSSAAYPTTRSPIFTPSFSASQRCLTAVEDICALCHYVRANALVNKLGPPFAFSLWVAARLLLVHGSTIDHQVNPAISPLVDTLREMGFHWRVADRYATLLQRVLDEYHDSERAPAGADGLRETPSTVRILADMRRCAYDLDFLISRQPRRPPSSSLVAAARRGRPSPVPPPRTPAPNELEYLDVFDFFNLPRLPVGDAALIPGAGDEAGQDYHHQHQQQQQQQHQHQQQPQQQQQGLEGGGVANGMGSNEFNITNFMYDANADWFVNGGGR